MKLLDNIISSSGRRKKDENDENEKRVAVGDDVDVDVVDDANVDDDDDVVVVVVNDDDDDDRRHSMYIMTIKKIIAEVRDNRQREREQHIKQERAECGYLLGRTVEGDSQSSAAGRQMSATVSVDHLKRTL